MKKTRLLSLFLFLTLLLANLTGCVTNNENADYTVLEVGSFDSEDGGIHASEFEMWDQAKMNYHQDETAPETASVTFNGKTYSGDYQRSAVRVPNFYVSHRYKGDGFFFEVNGETGELVSILFAYEPLASATVSQEKCKQLADSIAGDYINVSEYKVSVSEQSVRLNNLYSFTYYREISGYRTADSLTVSVDGSGKISSFNKEMTGSFDNIKSVPLNEEKANTAIETKLKAIYQNNSKWSGYSIENVILIKHSDGTCAFLYTVDNTFNEEGASYGSLVQLLMTTSHKGSKK